MACHITVYKPARLVGFFFVHFSNLKILNMTTSTLLKTEKNLALVKSTFSSALCERLHLHAVSCPLSVMADSGINDDLNGIERPVSFPVKGLGDRKATVVHSLAKWKRMRLAQLEIPVGEGILTDMRALRPDEDFSPVHSIYVDQWDWEIHMQEEDRSLAYLKQTVEKIYDALLRTELQISAMVDGVNPVLPEQITFIHAAELQRQYPHLSPKEREHLVCEKYKAVFLIGIGGIMENGEMHDGRAPDYDDWTTMNEAGYEGLNGDILVWNPVLKTAFELSSMGIRVNPEALLRQLAIRDCMHRSELPFHEKLLSGSLPQSIGGGIGQSRVCMFMLRKSHIREVQVSIWPEPVMV